MRPLKGLALVALMSCVTLATAHALTEEEAEQLDELWAGSSDITQGVEVDDATITVKDGWLLEGEDACAVDRLANGIEVCGISAIVSTPADVGILAIYYFPPENIGHVNMDDWTDDVNSEIDEIWEGYVDDAKAQSERVGFDIVPLKWVLYPTLNKAAKVMTYGMLLDWGGENVINLITVKFTRSGYVTMYVVTDEEMLAASSTTYDGVSI